MAQAKTQTRSRSDTQFDSPPRPERLRDGHAETIPLGAPMPEKAAPRHTTIVLERSAEFRELPRDEWPDGTPPGVIGVKKAADGASPWRMTRPEHTGGEVVLFLLRPEVYALLYEGGGEEVRVKTTTQGNDFESLRHFEAGGKDFARNVLISGGTEFSKNPVTGEWEPSGVSFKFEEEPGVRVPPKPLYRHGKPVGGVQIVVDLDDSNRGPIGRVLMPKMTIDMGPPQSYSGRKQPFDDRSSMPRGAYDRLGRCSLGITGWVRYVWAGIIPFEVRNLPLYDQ